MSHSALSAAAGATPVRSQTLYRFWDAEDNLLYVGISVRPWDRWKQHRAEKPWWEEVARVTLENFETREQVAAAELAAIKAEGPRYNIAGTQTVIAAVVAERQSLESWDGVHVPSNAFMGDLFTCSCAEPDWDDPRNSDETPWRNRPCGQWQTSHAIMSCDVCRPLYETWQSDHEAWVAEQPFFAPEEYAQHVIAATLGERFVVEARSAPIKDRKTQRKPSVKFVADNWPETCHLPRRWKHYARQWLDEGLTRDELRESVDIAVDAWAAGRTERPWAYLSGVTRRLINEKHQPTGEVD